MRIGAAAENFEFIVGQFLVILASARTVQTRSRVPIFRQYSTLERVEQRKT
jgi:hypothetical protein